MLLCQIVDLSIFNVLDPRHFCFSLSIHFFSQNLHLVLWGFINLLANPFELLSLLSLLHHLLLRQCIQILHMLNLLPFQHHLLSPHIFFMLSLINPILIFNILKCDHSLYLELCILVQVLKHLVLNPLLVYLSFNLMLFVQVLSFSFFIS